jgi:multiple sugar transport system ATP-binding protein
LAGVAFEQMSKVYPDGTKAVDALTLEIGDGEFMVLVGPSGCGKTTALRMVAGLEEISAGVLKIGDRVVNNVPSRDRDIAMVFQSYALYPHLSVYENIAFGLKIKKMPKEEIESRVADAARILGLEPFLKRKPRALSGGQRQRVAMGRAIVRQPQAFLMDEPLSNLDAKLRVQMRAEIAGLQRSLGVTTIYVTHDQVEAMTMGDRVAVMRKGELQQVADPQTLYDNPINLFVGGFIGSPSMNMVEATLARQNGGMVANVGAQKVLIDAQTLAARPALAGFEGKNVVLGIRPEDLEDAALSPDTPADHRLKGKVSLTEALGSEIMVHFTIEANQAATEEMRELAKDVGDERAVAQLEEGGTPTAPFVGRFGARSRVKIGDPLEVAVDSRALHFFDPETGLGIYDGTNTKGAT